MCFYCVFIWRQIADLPYNLVGVYYWIKFRFGFDQMLNCRFWGGIATVMPNMAEIYRAIWMLWICTVSLCKEPNRVQFNCALFRSHSAWQPTAHTYPIEYVTCEKKKLATHDSIHIFGVNPSKKHLRIHRRKKNWAPCALVNHMYIRLVNKQMLKWWGHARFSRRGSYSRNPIIMSTSHSLVR